MTFFYCLAGVEVFVWVRIDLKVLVDLKTVPMLYFDSDFLNDDEFLAS